MLFKMHDFRGALLTAIGLGDKILISQALRAQKGDVDVEKLNLEDDENDSNTLEGF